MWNFYASALGSMGRQSDSAAVHRRAIAIDPRLPVLWANLSVNLAFLRRGFESLSEATPPAFRIQAEIQFAGLLAQAGRTRECLELVAKLLRLPSGLTVHVLRIEPTWDRVRHESDFKALLADPKNSAPL